MNSISNRWLDVNRRSVKERGFGIIEHNGRRINQNGLIEVRDRSLFIAWGGAEDLGGDQMVI